jgi:hypothetical protein
LSEGIVPAGGNFLPVGYPKSFKTYLHMELAVACANGTPFLGRFATPGDIRTGVVLLEGGEREQAWRIHRIAQSRGIEAKDLNGFIHVWHRPPLKLSDPVAMRELGTYAKDLELDLLMVDAWAYASEGSSNEDWTVTPQLMALSRLRDQAPDLTTSLTHHARKGGAADPKGDRLTDLIRGSGSFGGWYHACMVLARKDENSPHVTVRTELREYPSPNSFVFAVTDDEPASPSNLYVPQGALRLLASSLSPEAIKRREAAKKKTEDVLDYITRTPGCSKRDLRSGVTGNNQTIDTALELLREEGRVTVREGGSFEALGIYPTSKEAA